MCFQFMPPFASVCLVSFCLMPPFASVCLVSLWFEIRNISGSSPCLGLDHLSRSLCQLVLGLDWQSAHLSGSISWWQIATNISEVPCLVRCQQLLSCIFNKMFDMVKVIHETEGWFYCNLGIPNGCRARSILFLRCSIQPKTKAYPAIGQRKLNGASSRLMMNFFAEISVEIQQSHPSDVHKWLGLSIFHGCLWT